MQKIIIASQDHIRFINQDEIICCRSDNCYTYIFLHTSEELLVSKSLAKFSKELSSEKFIRINQSYLVNVDYIRSIDKKKKLLYLTNLVQIHFTTSIKELLVKLIRRGAAIYFVIQHSI